MAGRTVTRQRVAQRTTPRAPTTSRPPAPAETDPAFHRAILKIALELKKPSARSYDAVVEETIRSMRLDPETFRHYLGANRAERMGLLLAAARKIGP
jgi:hypothetical protein